MRVKSVSIVLVTLNERKKIEILVPKLEILLKNFEIEIIIIDDASSDGTEEGWKYNLNAAGNASFVPNTTITAAENANTTEPFIFQASKAPVIN